MKIHLTPKSANAKTGPIPVSTSSKESCPSSCPLKSGCYAASGPLALHWSAVTKGERGYEYPEFLEAISKLPSGSLWRHNQAGDLAGAGESICTRSLSKLVKANQGKRGFTYTHKTKLKKNLDAIRKANDSGFTINLSANNLDEADSLIDSKSGPVVSILPIDSPKKTTTPKGRSVVTCPATYLENVSCATCKLCAISSRSTVIGFPAHGTSKKQAEKVFFMKVAA